MLLSEHVYCVTITFKMTEWVKQQMCIKFCIKLEYSSMETIQMIQKVIATGNCWSAASSGQFAHSCITSHAEFFDETSNHSAPLQPRFGILWLLAFPQTKSTFEREEISDRSTGQMMMIPLWTVEKMLGELLCTMFVLSCMFFNKCL